MDETDFGWNRRGTGTNPRSGKRFWWASFADLLRDLCGLVIAWTAQVYRPLAKVSLSSPGAVPVRHFHPISRFLQPLGHVFGNHYGPVLAAGAAESNRQIAFAFVNVMRQEVNEQIRDALDEPGGLRKRADVFC